MMVAGVAAVGAAAGVVAGAPVVVIAGATLASYSCVGAAGVSKLLEMQAENTRSITRDEWREKFAAYVARQGANKLLRKFAAKIGYQPQPAPKITNKLSERAAYARDVEPVAKDHTIEPHSHVPAATHELLEERLVSNISPQTNVSTTPTREPQDSVMPRPRMK